MLRKILGKNYNRFGGSIRLYDGQYVTTCDGVGTKALLSKDYKTIGDDVVNHCVNDLLCEFAIPVAFTNYIGMPVKKEKKYINLIDSMQRACIENDCKMIGGETAIMPDIYKDRALSVVGTMIGKQVAKPKTVSVGDYIVGLFSNGLHTNGYTVARQKLGNKLSALYKDKTTIRDKLLVPHKSYFTDIDDIMAQGVHIKSICHITGGGWSNLYRVLPNDIDFETHINYKQDHIFDLVSENMSFQEKYTEFNMGIGMVIIVDKNSIEKLEHKETTVLGKLVPGDGEVRINNKCLLREHY